MKHIGILESNLSGSGFEGLRIAKELGLRLTFFTRDIQRYLEVPGGPRYFEQYVDEIVYCETNELDPLMEHVRSVADRIPFDAFLTMGEYDVVVAAEVARRLGLPTVDPGAVAAARNKVWMRQRCAEHDVPMPAFRDVATADEVRAAVASVGLPCVVKPADETSSADVMRCTTVEDAVDQFHRIRAKRENTRGQERFPRVLVEECLHGYEVSVEVLAEGERLHIFGVADKSIAGHDHFVEVGHDFPSVLPSRIVAGCERVAAQALRAVGFDLGMAHVEIKVTRNGPSLIEINPRPAGGKITDLIDHSVGYSCLELVVRQYLGEQVIGALRCGPRRGAAIRYLTAPPGRVTSVTGLELAQAMPGVHEAVVKVDAGDEVRPLRRNGDRLGHVLATAEDTYVASRLAAAAAHEISIATSTDRRDGGAQSPTAAAPRVARSIADLIGSTPLVRLRDGIPTEVTVLAKLEMTNPMSSIKDRAALFMLRSAEERGLLKPGTGSIIEASSGNTGISLAALAAARGYRCVIVLPDSATQERINILRALGAEVVLTPRNDGYPGAIAKAEELHRATPGSWFPCQHENLDNIRAHYETTGPEIWTDCGGTVDVLVCGVGTGGTLSGIARYLKERNPLVRVVAVEPEKSPVLSQGVGGLHRIPGLNGGFVAATTDVDCIDEVITVSDEDALETTRRLARTSGLFVGVSSGAAAFACARLASKPEYAGRTLVTVFPDTGERYLTLWQEDDTSGGTR